MSTYLVTGATGFQGGAVVDYLLAAGAKVHAVVRDQSSPRSVALREKGVVLFEGTHEEPDTVFRAAAAGCIGLFLNPSVFEPGKARAQADAIIKASKLGAGETLTSIVLSSTVRTDELSTQGATVAAVHPFIGAYYTAKAEVEAAVRESGIRDYTILRPPVLAHDYLMPHSATPHGNPQLPRTGTLVTSLNDGTTMPYLDERDVGKFAAAALLDPARFSGHEFAIAGDNLTAEEVADALARVSGIDVKFHRRSPEEKERTKNEEFFQVFEELENQLPGPPVDVAALEAKYGIRPATFVEYFERHKEELLDSLPPRAAAFL